jgi:hypothetical protein|tara:strand:- start:258 stop:407 length:150 start_codon:yes stop_codon:yes gene_type:complete
MSKLIVFNNKTEQWEDLAVYDRSKKPIRIIAEKEGKFTRVSSSAEKEKR